MKDDRDFCPGCGAGPGVECHEICLSMKRDEELEKFRTALNLVLISTSEKDIENICKRALNIKIDTTRWEGADPGTCGMEFHRKDMNAKSVCGRDLNHTGAHSWYHDCWSCKGTAGDHKSSCRIYPPKERV